MMHPLARVLVFDRFGGGNPVGQAASMKDAQEEFGQTNIAGDLLMYDSQTGKLLGEIYEE